MLNFLDNWEKISYLGGHPVGTSAFASAGHFHIWDTE